MTKERNAKSSRGNGQEMGSETKVLTGSTPEIALAAADAGALDLARRTLLQEVEQILSPSEKHRAPIVAATVEETDPSALKMLVTSILAFRTLVKGITNVR